MKKITPLLVLLASCLLFLSGEPLPPDNNGQAASPVYLADGSLCVVYEREGGVFFSHISQTGDAPIFYSQLLLQKPARCPDIKKGQGEDLWAVWEAAGEKRSDIFVSFLKSGSPDTPFCLSKDLEGANSSPSLAVDKNGFPWIAWINRWQGLDRIFVIRMETGQIWQANSILTPRVSTPLVAVDDNLDAWVFWVSLHRGPGEIIGRRLSGGLWSVEHPFNSDCSIPHLDPDVSLDGAGRPWIVWSAYDGEDYEIFHSRWTGSRWTPEVPLTDNRGLSDLSPSFRFFSSGSMAVLAWSQASTGSRICLKKLQNGRWERTRYLSRFEPFNRRPKIAQSPDRIAVAWENTSDGQSRIQMAAFPCLSIENLGFPASPPSVQTEQPFFSQNSPSAFSSSTIEPNRLSAFGDSITYGVLSRTWFPDKGYVPRLDLLVKNLSPDFHVINRGIPGEKTAEGLARIEEEIRTYRAKYVLLMEGTNDMTEGVPSQTAAFNMEEMIKKCFQNGVYPLLGTIIPRSDLLWRGSLKENTLVLNDFFRGLASLLKIPLTDHYQVFIDHPAGYLDLFSDGAHPNEDGYQKVAESWFQSLDSIPWPPVDLAVERKTDRILFSDQPVNILSWKKNPLLSSQTQIERYTIYRKTEDSSGSGFAVLAVVSGESFSYMDTEVSSELSYSYFLLGTDDSGVEGPASASASDKEA